MSVGSSMPLSRLRGIAPSALADASIVVVDDTPENVLLLERILEHAGCSRVRGFTDPRAALESCADERPDLILLDLHMPELDAVEVMGRLGEVIPERALVPVIVLTADITPEARERVLTAGAKDFLTKPFDAIEVVLRVRNMVETVVLYQQLEAQNVDLESELAAAHAAEQAAAMERAALEDAVAGLFAPGVLAMHFQPIVDTTSGSTIGYEALARFATEPMRPPNEWFADAANVGRGVELELFAIRAALARLDDLPSGTGLSINASPSAVCSGELAALLQPVAERIVVELTEHHRVDDYEPLLRSLAELRRMGVRLAVDDTGAGYASLQHILRLGADILKLDIGLTRGIDTDPVRRSLAAALVAFANDIGAVILAEGVETAEELTTLKALGVTRGQGYHLGRPAPLPPASPG